MARPIQEHSEPVNSDSFLDIVASVVSIMIIMVVLEGSRIKNQPIEMSIPADPANAALEKDMADERAMQVDVAKAAAQIQSIERETARRGVERDVLATMVAAAEHKIAQERKQLDATKQADFDLARGLAESKLQLEQLAKQREQVDRDSSAPVVIESYPTPISRAVDGPETHLMIANGRAIFVPIEPLLEEFQSQARRQVYRLREESEFTDTVGPIDGFRLRYTLERHEIAPDSQGRGGAYARLQRWTLVPAANDLGEPIRLAMQPDSEFRAALKKILPGRTTITIWIYPDGFEAFREIRKELYRLGYTIAARPLPTGQAISGSPEGSKSAAQ